MVASQDMDIIIIVEEIMLNIACYCSVTETIVHSFVVGIQCLFKHKDPNHNDI